MWRSPQKFVRLLNQWSKARFDGDGSMFEALSGWAKQDRHLWQWESDQRAKAERARLDLYRNVSAAMASRYEKVVIDDTNYAEIAREPEPEEAGRNQRADTNRTLAAISYLRSAIKNACSRRGVSCEVVQSNGLTTTCPACGAADAAHRHDDGLFACSHCTHVDSVVRVDLLNKLIRSGNEQSAKEIVRRANEIAANLKGGRFGNESVAAE